MPARIWPAKRFRVSAWSMPAETARPWRALRAEHRGRKSPPRNSRAPSRTPASDNRERRARVAASAGRREDQHARQRADGRLYVADLDRKRRIFEGGVEVVRASSALPTEQDFAAGLDLLQAGALDLRGHYALFAAAGLVCAIGVPSRRARRRQVLRSESRDAHTPERANLLYVSLGVKPISMRRRTESILLADFPLPIKDFRPGDLGINLTSRLASAMEALFLTEAGETIPKHAALASGIRPIQRPVIKRPMKTARPRDTARRALYSSPTDIRNYRHEREKARKFAPPTLTALLYTQGTACSPSPPLRWS